MKQISKKTICIDLLILLVCIGIITFIHQYSPVDVLEIQESKQQLVPGETNQYTVKGYKRKGETLEEVDISEIPISWRAYVDDDSFTINEKGILTARQEGAGTIQAYYKDKVFSRPMTIDVVVEPLEVDPDIEVKNITYEDYLINTNSMFKEEYSQNYRFYSVHYQDKGYMEEYPIEYRFYFAANKDDEIFTDLDFGNYVSEDEVFKYMSPFWCLNIRANRLYIHFMIPGIEQFQDGEFQYRYAFDYEYSGWKYLNE